MRVPAIVYADEDLIRGMDDKVFTQATNVAMLPGIIGASYAMPDAHRDMAFRSAAWRHSIPRWVASPRLEAWDSIFPVVCARC